MRPIIFLAAVTSLVAAAPSDAGACSPLPCWPGSFTPGSGATVPANLPAIYWRPSGGFDTSPADPSKVVLASAAAPSTPLPFTATQLPDGDYVLVPDRPLTPGTAYVLTDQTTCGGRAIGPSVTFQVADAAPPPASLGELTETASLVGPLELEGGASCSFEVDAHQIGIGLLPGFEATTWRDVLHFETLVDGRVWDASRIVASVVPPEASGRGRGFDLLYRICRTDEVGVPEGLAAGPHEVEMRATLPGSGVVVRSSSLTVDVDCADDDGSPDTDGTGGGCDAGGSGSSEWLLLGSLAAVAGLRRRTARRSG